MIVGNELAAYYNNQGNIARRLLIFRFTKRPAQIDTQLPKKLASEIPSILVCVNRAYLAMLEEVRRIDPEALNVKNVLPPYFLQQEVAMAGERNPLQAALHHADYFVFATNKSSNAVYCPKKVFWDVYKQFCRDQQIPFRAVDQTIIQVLRQYGISEMKSRGGLRRCYRKYPRKLLLPALPPSDWEEQAPTSTIFFTNVDVSPRFAFHDSRYGVDTRFEGSLPFDVFR